MDKNLTLMRNIDCINENEVKLKCNLRHFSSHSLTMSYESKIMNVLEPLTEFLLLTPAPREMRSEAT